MSAEIHALHGRHRELPAPPVSIESEQAVLGSLLLHNEIIGPIAGNVSVEDFSEEIHRRTFECAVALIADKKPATPATLRAYIGDADIVPGLSVPAYLARLCSAALPVAVAVGHARIVRSLAARRAIVAAAAVMDSHARDAAVSEDPASIATEHMRVLQGIACASGGDTARHVGEYADELISVVDGIRSGEIAHRLITTGYADVDHATSGYVPGGLWITAGRPGMGKAQPLDALVLTPVGFVPISSLRIGQTITHPRLGTCKVASLHPQGRKAIYKVTFWDGRQVRCCDDHLWEVRHRQWLQNRVVPLSFIRGRSDPDRFYIPLASAGFGSLFGHSLSAYAVGAMIGDGCFHEVRGPLFSTADAEILDRLQAGLPRGLILINESSTYNYRIANRAGKFWKNNGGVSHRALFDSVGLTGDVKSATKRVPPSLLHADEFNRLEVLRGLLDTDGTVEPSKTVRFSSISEGLADDVVWLVRSLGGMAKKRLRATCHYTHKNERRAGQTCWVVTIRHPTPRELFTLPRKIEKLGLPFYSAATLGLGFKSIEEDGEEECICIKIDAEDGLYFTNEFAITHNTMAANSTAYRCAKSGVGVLEFPLEIGPTQMTARHLADIAYSGSGSVAFRDIGPRANELSELHVEAVRRASRRLRELPIEIDRRSRVSVAQISAKVAQTKSAMAARDVELGLIIIDHLDFIHASDRYGGNRTQEIGEICLGLKDIAQTYGVCINLMCQLNRGLEQRAAKDRRPTLADLRNSGDLEQVADVVMFLYREEYYLLRTPEYLAGEPDAIDKAIAARGKLEAILGKVRAGPTPTVHLFCEPASSSISSYARGA